MSLSVGKGGEEIINAPNNHINMQCKSSTPSIYCLHRAVKTVNYISQGKDKSHWARSMVYLRTTHHDETTSCSLISLPH